MNTILACNTGETGTVKPLEKTDKHPSMDWIIGAWVGGVPAEGLKSREVWKKVSEGRFAGDAEMRKDGELVSSEHMEISLQDGHHCLVVEHSQSDTPIVFNFTFEDENSFICRNDENDFPKQIEYRRAGDELIAIISEGGPRMEFRFKQD